MPVNDSHVSRQTPSSRGKFLVVDDEPLLIRGVSYGSFAPRDDGHEFPEREQVARDFRLMADAGVNAVRTYTVPPEDVLDAASEHGLRVMAGVTWPQHVAFLDDRHLQRNILRDIHAQVRSIARHPALLLTAIGNEIPPAVVRWHGRRRVEQFIRAAFDEARTAAPGQLFTYVNYPPTEFLELPFLDVYAFNVYLHAEQAMRGYMARIHHLAADRPLLVTECGADSLRHGQDGQAALAAMQVRVAFSEGAAGAIVFGWTDEWWRGGVPIVDWSFGLVDRVRRPKAAYGAVSTIFRSSPFTPDEQRHWPSVSVVVCVYNGAATIDDCLQALERLDYPRMEIIVVDDGSTDDTAARVRRYSRAQLIQTANEGLSASRNVGLHAARGDIVAYVDADVRVEPSWLSYLVQPFVTSDAVAAGGPNVVPADDDWFAQCVARAPGAPRHVLLDDRIAEHVPGCNLAIRRRALMDIGGFDPIFLRAGDDVDVCWRLQERGGRVAFSPTALVWHHHRSRLSAYWRQQVGYGEGEAWLRERHRHRFSRSAVAWRGRIYSGLPFVRSLTERQLHSGVWGTAAFPTVYHTSAHPMQAIPHTPEWQCGAAVVLLAGVIALTLDGGGTLPLALTALGVAALATTLLKCAVYAWRSDLSDLPPIGAHGLGVSRALYRATLVSLHLVQPFARWYGFVRGARHPPALTRPKVAQPPSPVAAAQHRPPLRRQRGSDLLLILGRARRCRFWSDAWTSGDTLLTRLIDRLRTLRGGRGIQVDDGWRCDRDVSVALGVWGWAHLQALVEDHGSLGCLFRVRVSVRPRGLSLALVVVTAGALLVAVVSRAELAAAAAASALLLLAKAARTISRNTRQLLDAVAAVASEHGMHTVADGTRASRGQQPSSWGRRLPATHGG